MRGSLKPVRKCHACPLNRGDHCWLFECPREKWKPGRSCPAFEDAAIHRLFERWRRLPAIKTRKDLRRAEHRTRRKPRPEGTEWCRLLAREGRRRTPQRHGSQ